MSGGRTAGRTTGVCKTRAARIWGRRPRRLHWLLPLPVLVLPLASWGLAAWDATGLREAYLSDLEAKAARQPHDGRLLSLLGARLAQAGEYGAAARHLERAVAAGEVDLPVWLTWAAAEAAADDAARAGAVLRLGMRSPRVAVPLREAIERCRPLGSAPPAQALAQAICPEGTSLLVRARTKGSWLNGLVEWEGRRRPGRSGFTTRERWARAKPDSSPVQVLWSQALLRTRRYIEAEAAARRAVELDPVSPEARVSLARALAAQGFTAKAGLEYVACLKLRKDWLPALMGLGHVALEKKLLPIGVDVFRRAVAQAPGSADAWIGLGRAHYNQRLRFADAVAAFQRASQLEPGRTDFFADYSNALRATFRFAEAEALLRRRLARAPEDVQSKFLLALVLLDHRPTPEREAEAEQALQTSRRVQPGVAAVEARLGTLLLTRGSAAEALPLLEGALREDPYHVMAQMSLGRAYRLLGRRRDADKAQRRLLWLSQYTQRLAFLEDQMRRQPSNPTHYRELGTLYAGAGETEKARRQGEIVRLLEAGSGRASRGLRAFSEATSATRAP